MECNYKSIVNPRVVRLLPNTIGGWRRTITLLPILGRVALIRRRAEFPPGTTATAGFAGVAFQIAPWNATAKPVRLRRCGPVHDDYGDHRVLAAQNQPVPGHD